MRWAFGRQLFKAFWVKISPEETLWTMEQVLVTRSCCCGPKCFGASVDLDQIEKISNLVFDPFPNKPWFLRVFSTSLLKTLEKGEIAHNEHFLLFPQCFQLVQRNFFHFDRILNCCLQTLSVWKSLKFVVWERVNRECPN